MRVGSLCTGYGGVELGLTLAGVDVDLRWFAEIDEDVAGIVAKDHPGVPNLGDITAVDWLNDSSAVDLLTAGFPCQPTSAAGRRLGDGDPRWLWPHVFEAVRRIGPAQVLIENVRNLVSYDKGRLWAGILADLTGAGYDVRWLTLGACHVGAAHHRHRVFLLATRRHWAPGRVERVATTWCGVKGGLLSDLLPTPSAASYGSNQGGAAGRVGPVRYSLESLAKLDLLPTPTARDGDGRGEGDAAYWAAKRRTNGIPLGAELTLLPTPSAASASGGRRDRAPGADGRIQRDRGESHGMSLDGAVQHPQHWGRFAEAVARHESLYGPAPAPTEPNRNGAPRLAAPFAQWLMCLPAGHVTDVLGRVPALRAIGNGVCPPQLAAAWALLIGVAA